MSVWTRTMSFRDQKSTEELVELYEEEDLLWNTLNQDYNKKDKRRQAISRISSMLGVPASEVTRKLTNLRTYYCKEIKKLLRSQGRASKGERLYVSKWDYFKSLDRFLFPFVQGRKLVDGSAEEDDAEDDDDDDDTTVDNHEDTTTTESLNSRKRKYPDDQPSGLVAAYRERSRRPHSKPTESFMQRDDMDEFDVLEEVETHVQLPVTTPRGRIEDGEDVFGKHVANELRLISDIRARQLVKVKVQNLLFEAQFGSHSETQPCASSTSVSGIGASRSFQEIPLINETPIPFRTSTGDSDI